MIQVLYLLEEHWSLCVHYHDQLEEIIVRSALTCAHFGMYLDKKWNGPQVVFYAKWGHELVCLLLPKSNYGYISTISTNK